HRRPPRRNRQLFRRNPFLLPHSQNIFRRLRLVPRRIRRVDLDQILQPDLRVPRYRRQVAQRRSARRSRQSIGRRRRHLRRQRIRSQQRGQPHRGDRRGHLRQNSSANSSHEFILSQLFGPKKIRAICCVSRRSACPCVSGFYNVFRRF